MSDAQRDSQRAWAYLDRLFDWAGNRSKPMPVSDLAEIRTHVIESLDRLVDRADDLERAPLLKSVEVASDGMRTVSIDMRDGTRRKFQTRADWFDDSPTLADPVPAEVIELRDRLLDQVAKTTEQTRKSAELQESIVSLEAQLQAAQMLLAEARDRSNTTIVEAREEGAQSVSQEAREKIAELEIERDEWQERYTKAIRRMDEIEASVSKVDASISSRAAELEEERDMWERKYYTALKVVDEALPAISDLLAERTKELEDERRGIGGTL